MTMAFSRSKHSTTMLPFQINDRWFAVSVSVIEGVGQKPAITLIPGNKSRVLVGLAYLFGELMTAIDLGALLNLGSSRRASQMVIIRSELGYFALLADEVGSLIHRPQVRTYKKPLFACANEYFDHAKKKITVIDTTSLTAMLP